MSGFSCPPSIVPAPDADPEAVIANDGWFPEISPDAVRKAARISDTITIERLRDAILSAMLLANENLADFKTAAVAAGRANLAAVPDTTIGGEHRRTVLYRQAVAAWAKALIVERYRDTDLTGAGDRKADALDSAPSEHRRDALHAVRSMLGVGRTTVELI